MDSSFHFLLVDDNPNDQLLAAEAFQEIAPDSELVTATSGLEALQVLYTMPSLPKLILLDIHMPGMNGFEVLQAIKADPRLQGVPVVMFSTSNAQADIERAYALRASSYLIKANDYHGFLRQVAAVVAFWTLARPFPA